MSKPRAGSAEIGPIVPINGLTSLVEPTLSGASSTSLKRRIDAARTVAVSPTSCICSCIQQPQRFSGDWQVSERGVRIRHGEYSSTTAKCRLRGDGSWADPQRSPRFHSTKSRSTLPSREPFAPGATRIGFPRWGPICGTDQTGVWVMTRATERKKVWCSSGTLRVLSCASLPGRTNGTRTMRRMLSTP